MRRFTRHHPLVCQEFIELVTDYLDGALPDRERARFEAHLAECEGCTGYLADMRRIVRSLEEMPVVPADAEVRVALLAAFRDLRGAAEGGEAGAEEAEHDD